MFELKHGKDIIKYTYFYSLVEAHWDTDSSLITFRQRKEKLDILEPPRVESKLDKLARETFHRQPSFWNEHIPMQIIVNHDTKFNLHIAMVLHISAKQDFLFSLFIKSLFFIFTSSCVKRNSNSRGLPIMTRRCYHYHYRYQGHGPFA